MSKPSANRRLAANRISFRRLAGRALLAIVLPLGFAMAPAHGVERSAEAIVDEVCGNCHKKGDNGAPVIGDEKAWAERKTQGLTNLTGNALEGIRKMPSHGGNMGLSAADLERAITYMVNQSGGNWTEPKSAASAGKERTGEQVVKAKCSECHADGKNGAPKIGDQSAWVGRVSHGLDAVIASGIHGRGAMPARGGMADLSDAEMRAAVIYMFTQSVVPKKK